MKLFPFAMIFAAALLCGSFREKMQPSPSHTPEVSSEQNRDSSPAPISPDSPARAVNNVMAVSVSGGVMNDKATYLPQPVYPPAARAVHASGKVMVQVSVNTSGTVDSAVAVSGHRLLRAAAEKAARQAKFEPLVFSGGQRVRVSGVINYEFVP